MRKSFVTDQKKLLMGQELYEQILFDLGDRSEEAHHWLKDDQWISRLVAEKEAFQILKAHISPIEEALRQTRRELENYKQALRNADALEQLHMQEHHSDENSPK